MKIHTLDLKFLDLEGLIAAYLIQQGDANILVECGPSSLLPNLEQELQKFGLGLKDITHVLPTHIHFDHAGAAGHLAEQGAEVFIHHVGFKHLLDPSKLWGSASRIYGSDAMEALWGKILPIPEKQLHSLEDGQVISIEGLDFLAVDTPGHANHHMAYFLEDQCFSGDVGGACIPGYRQVRLPTPPPEFDLELWLQSVNKLKAMKPSRLFLTHFGGFDRAVEFLDQVEQELLDATSFVDSCFQLDMEKADIVEAYSGWFMEKIIATGIGDEGVQLYQTVAADVSNVNGILRYLKKKRQA